MIFTILGILLIVFALTMLVVKSVVPLRTESKTIGEGFRATTLPPHPKFLTSWNFRKSLLTFVGGVILMFVSSCFFYAKQGHQYYVANMFGGVSCYYEPGLKLIVPFSRVQEWEKIIDIKTVANGEATNGIDGVISETTEYTATDLESGKTQTYKLNGIPVRFNDQVRANVQVSVRIQLPQNDEAFIALVEDFREPHNLVYNTLIPTVKEQVINCAFLFSGEDYVSGEAANFRQALDDALKIGGLAVNKKEKPDTVFSDIEVDGQRKILDISRVVIVTPKLDANGKEIRIDHDIKKNQLVVSQVIVDHVNLEPKFQQKLERQRDISAQKSIEIQLTETAEMEQQRIIAQGERDKAEERVIEEKKQVKVLIAIETDKKEEETARELAAIRYETEKINAQTTKVMADAKAYEIANADGLSERQKYELDIELEKAKYYAKAIENAKFPTFFINGGSGPSGNGGSFLEQLIGAEMAKRMIQ